MTTNEMLQEHVTCPVCLDIFDDPHSLECRHIVCLPCLNRLKERGRVECPECREQMPFKRIKRDFKTAKLAESLKKEKEGELKKGIPDRQPTGCEVCKNPRKAVVSRCKTCDKYICQDCEVAHKGVGATKNHVIESKAEIISALQDKAKTNLSITKEDLEKVEQNLSHISASISLINEKKATQQAKLNVRIDRLILQLENRRAKLKHDLIKGNDSTLKTLTQNKQVFENHKALLQGSIGSLTKLSTINDLESLMAPHTSKNIKDDIRQLECIFQDSPVKVVNGLDCNVNTYLTVYSANYSFADLMEVRCIQEEDNEVERDIKKMYMINNKLWCCGGDKIRIYNKNCTLKWEMTYNEITDIRGLTKVSNGDVIVACEENCGLHHINSEEEYVCEILEGSFSDVGYYNQCLYAMDYDAKKCYVFEKEDSKWLKKFEWQVGDSITVNSETKLFVNRIGLFISSNEDKRIYQFSHKGDLMQKTGGMSSGEDDDVNDNADDQDGNDDDDDDEVDHDDDDDDDSDVVDDDEVENVAGMLKNPVLCGVDSDGIALVADYDQNIFQLYNFIEQTWQIIDNLEDIEQPISVVLDGNDLFILTLSELLKYKLV